MYIWQWLSKLSPPIKEAVTRSAASKTNPQEILLLINFMDIDAKYSRFSNTETIAKHVLKRADKLGDYFTKALAHKVLGRLFFEKGMFTSALAQFERALNSYEEVLETDKQDEFSAKLHAWIGLCALRTSEFEKAVNAFKTALSFLEKNGGNRFVIGELKALLGDALSFINPENALSEFEEAHELMKNSPSVLFISNGLKLFSALVFRKYHREAASILSEVGENIIKAIKGMNLTVYQSIKKIYKGPFLKALSLINLKGNREIKGLFSGVEGVKGIYFLFRFFLKPLIKIKDLTTYNQAILIASRLMNQDYIDEVIARKNKFLRVYDTGNLSSYKLKNKYGFTRLSVSLDTLVQIIRKRFRKVMMISLTKLNNPQEYLLLSTEYPISTTIMKRIKLDVDDIIYYGKKSKEINESVSALLPVDLESSLLNYTEQDIVLFSVNDILYQLPWEALFVGESRLGLKTNIVRVPTLYQLALWNQDYYHFKLEKIAIIELMKQKKLIKNLVNILRKRRYRVYLSENINANYLTNEHINLLIVANYLQDMLGDEIFIRMGNAFLSVKDIEKLDISGDLVVIIAPYAMEVSDDTVSNHNLPMSFLMSGFKSALVINSDLSIRDQEILINEINNITSKNSYVANIALELRRKIYSYGKNWWQNVSLSGSPLVSI